MAQRYFKEKKIFLGTNKNSYITTNEAGEIVISTEAGGETKINNNGITHKRKGEAFEALGGGGSSNLVTLTQAEYDALGSYDASTIYITT
jgi:hypothetical protein